MSFFILAFLTSLVTTLLVVRSASLHAWMTADTDFTGPQKFHTRAVPRIGGVGVLVAMAVAGVFDNFTQKDASSHFWVFIACGLPAFLVGIAEDLTKKVAARWRLLATCVSAALAIWLLGAVILRTDIPGIDQLIRWMPMAIALTLLCVTGVAHAVNIIDGFNGLASMCAMMMLLGTAYVAFQSADEFVASTALIAAGAVLGFFVWNFPAGLIFLGDGGAYFIGFVVAELSDTQPDCLADRSAPAVRLFASHATVLKHTAGIRERQPFSLAEFLLFSLVHELSAIRRTALNLVTLSASSERHAPDKIQEFARAVASVGGPAA